MRRPSRIGLDDRAEIVVEQHDRRRLARHVGAAAAHGDADVRRLERRRVVDAVAGHRDDLAVRLERVDDAQLLLGHDPREHRRGCARARPAPSSLSVSSSSPVTTSSASSPACARDRPGGRRVVAGDHHHPDAGRPAFARRRRARSAAADRQARPAPGTRRRNRAANPAKSRPRMSARATPSTRRPSAAIASTDCVSAARSAGVEMAEVGDRFGRALGRDDEFLSAVGRPARRATWRAGRVEARRRATSVHPVPCRCSVSPSCSRPRSWNAFSIGSNGSRRAGEHAELDQVVELRPALSRRQLRAAERSRRPRAAARRSTSGSRSACRSCRCTARSRSPASRSPRRAASARAPAKSARRPSP